MDITIGTFVKNFGILARVIGFHEITGEPILQSLDFGDKWVANPELCKVIPSFYEHEITIL